MKEVSCKIVRKLLEPESGRNNHIREHGQSYTGRKGACWQRVVLVLKGVVIGGRIAFSRVAQLAIVSQGFEACAKRL